MLYFIALGVFKPFLIILNASTWFIKAVLIEGIHHPYRITLLSLACLLAKGTSPLSCISIPVEWNPWIQSSDTRYAHTYVWRWTIFAKELNPSYNLYWLRSPADKAAWGGKESASSHGAEVMLDTVAVSALQSGSGGGGRQGGEGGREEEREGERERSWFSAPFHHFMPRPSPRECATTCGRPAHFDEPSVKISRTDMPRGLSPKCISYLSSWPSLLTVTQLIPLRTHYLRSVCFSIDWKIRKYIAEPPCLSQILTCFSKVDSLKFMYISVCIF